MVLTLGVIGNHSGFTPYFCRVKRRCDCGNRKLDRDIHADRGVDIMPYLCYELELMRVLTGLRSVGISLTFFDTVPHRNCASVDQIGPYRAQ